MHFPVLRLSRRATLTSPKGLNVTTLRNTLNGSATPRKATWHVGHTGTVRSHAERTAAGPCFHSSPGLCFLLRPTRRSARSALRAQPELSRFLLRASKAGVVELQLLVVPQPALHVTAHAAQRPQQQAVRVAHL